MQKPVKAKSLSLAFAFYQNKLILFLCGNKYFKRSFHTDNKIVNRLAAIQNGQFHVFRQALTNCIFCLRCHFGSYILPIIHRYKVTVARHHLFDQLGTSPGQIRIGKGQFSIIQCQQFPFVNLVAIIIRITGSKVTDPVETVSSALDIFT